MVQIDTIRGLLSYSDWANEQVLGASAELADDQLDQPFDMGPGLLRRTLIHIYNGEHVWLQRWQGKIETPWPSEDEKIGITDLRERLRRTWAEREQFLASLNAGQPSRNVIYRDSKGSLFSATLGDMMIQMCTHSTHHRAQAVNMLRRLTSKAPELDYMMWVRKPLADRQVNG